MVNNIVSVISSPSNSHEFLTAIKVTKDKNGNLPGDSGHSLTNPQREKVCKNRMEVERFKVELSEDLDEGADDV